MTVVPGRRVGATWRRYRRKATLSIAAFLIGAAGAAFGYWTVSSLSDGGGNSVAQATSLSTPTTPTANANGGAAVTVGWSLPSSQVPGAAYQVIRTSPDIFTVCTVAAAATSCQDSGLATGTSYTYSVMAVLDGWQSPPATTSATTLAVTTSAPPSGEVSVAYSFTPTAIGGTGTYASWALTGTLPAGLNFNSTTGVVSGTPTASGTTSGLVLTVTDSSNGAVSSSPFSITINAGPTVTTSSLAGATAAQIAYSQTLVSSGGIGAITWTLTSGSLPANLSLIASSGLISGTVNSSATSQTFTVVATDSNGVASIGQSLTIVVNAAPTVTTTSLAAATKGQVGYSQLLLSGAGTTPITWGMASGSLPNGLSLTSSSGLISGTVSGAASSQTFTVVATDTNGVASIGKSLTIVVNAAPTVTTSSLATATNTQTGYSQALVSSGGTGAITWSVSSGVLPANLSLTASTGAIAGDISGSASTQVFTVVATDANAVSSTGKALTITVNAVPSITTSSLATATDTQAGYAQTLTRSGGTTPMTWTVSAGSLPTGLSLSPSSGLISGTLGSTATTQTFTVVATDARGVASVGKSLTITVNAAPAVTTSAATPATKSQIGYSQTLTASGGTGAITWSLLSGTLPVSLALTGSTGLISGNLSASATTHTFTVVATDANGVASAGKSLTITVNTVPSVTTASLGTATDTQVGYTQTLTSTGGTMPITWSVSSGSLPTGLTLAAATGVISGTLDTNATTQTFTVVATDTNDVPSVGTSLTLVVNPAPNVTTAGLATGSEDQAGYSQTLTSTGGTPPTIWTISSGALPTGLILAADTGVISGTVGGTATTQTFTVVATDSNGVASIGKSLTLTVTGPNASAFTSAGPGNSASTGIPEPGDTVVITFSKAVLPSSICSLWTATTGAQTLGTNGSANATVILAQTGGGHDTMAVVDTADCSGGIKIFSGASLDLGTSGYVLGGGGGTASFAYGPCTVANQCTNVTLDSTDTILTITFGGLQTGTGTNSAPIANPGVTYTPDPSITGTSGAVVAGTASDVKSFFF